MTLKRAVYIVAGLVAIAAFVYVYYTHDPSRESFFPKCLFMSLTGYKCPGCGSQRAIHSLLTGNLSLAWHYNPLVVLAIPALAVFGSASALRRRVPRYYNRVNSPVVIGTILVVVVLWWGVRNVFGM